MKTVECVVERFYFLREGFYASLTFFKMLNCLLQNTLQEVSKILHSHHNNHMWSFCYYSISFQIQFLQETYTILVWSASAWISSDVYSANTGITVVSAWKCFSLGGSLRWSDCRHFVNCYGDTSVRFAERLVATWKMHLRMN